MRGTGDAFADSFAGAWQPQALGRQPKSLRLFRASASHVGGGLVMYGAVMNGRATALGFVAVREADDIALLVKEAEIVTGKPGRQFVVAGPERRDYRVAVGPFFFEVTRLDDGNEPIFTDVVMVEDLGQHRLGAALKSGRLFTPVVN
jgi:hypothetical protein